MQGKCLYGCIHLDRILRLRPGQALLVRKSVPLQAGADHGGQYPPRVLDVLPHSAPLGQEPDHEPPEHQRMPTQDSPRGEAVERVVLGEMEPLFVAAELGAYEEPG